jgi:prepilin-type N-terminal cleavage/methylation domain-containing protein
MNNNGFTIIEVVVSISIATVISIALLTISLGYVGDTMRARLTADLAIESQLLLRAMVEDVRLAGSLSTTNQNTDANAPVGGWITNDPSNIVIIDLPAIDASRNIIYDTTTGFPYDNEVVYFSNGTTMYRRTIVNPSATGNSLQTSCPPNLATSNCPNDKKYSQYLSDLSFTFYDDANATTSDATLARSVQINVKLQRKIMGKTVAFNNTIRTTLRNR